VGQCWPCRKNKGVRTLFSSKKGPATFVFPDIVGEKLRIQTDNTEHGIAPELIQAGIPKANIFLAFRPPEVRRHTEYAVA
jgi:hypothetical protein